MSGLRINYSKSEVFVVGCDSQTSSRIASAFNCKTGSFPVKYLGIPIDKDRLTKEELSEPAVKVERRLETWKCGQLFWGEDGPSEYQPY